MRIGGAHKGMLVLLLMRNNHLEVIRIGCADWVQAIASCILAVVTGVYVYLTRRLLEESNTAFVDVLAFGFIKDHYETVVKNYGPGIATEVKIYVKLNNLVKCLQGEKDIGSIIQATGPTVVPVNVETNYIIPGSKYSRGKGIVPIYIKYKTVSGKRFNYEWEYDYLNEPHVKFIKKHRKLTCKEDI